MRCRLCDYWLHFYISGNIFSKAIEYSRYHVKSHHSNDFLWALASNSMGLCSVCGHVDTSRHNTVRTHHVMLREGHGQRYLSYTPDCWHTGRETTHRALYSDPIYDREILWLTDTGSRLINNMGRLASVIGIDMPHSKYAITREILSYRLEGRSDVSHGSGSIIPFW